MSCHERPCAVAVPEHGECDERMPDRGLIELACLICLPYMIQHIDQVPCYCDELVHDPCAILPSQEEDIKAVNSKNEQAKRLLFYLIQNGKMWRLFETLGNDNIRQKFIEKEISIVLDDLILEHADDDGDDGHSGDEFRSIVTLVARKILLENDLDPLKAHLYSTPVTRALLTRLVNYNVISPAEKKKVKPGSAESAKVLVDILSGRDNGDMFALIAVSADEDPSTWTKLNGKIKPLSVHFSNLKK